MTGTAASVGGAVKFNAERFSAAMAEVCQPDVDIILDLYEECGGKIPPYGFIVEKLSPNMAPDQEVADDGSCEDTRDLVNLLRRTKIPPDQLWRLAVLCLEPIGP